MELTQGAIRLLAMLKAERFKLHFGPYRTPRFKYGDLVRDQMRGKVRVIGLSEGRIPWPIIGRTSGVRLAFYGDLVKAVHGSHVRQWLIGGE